MCIEPLRKVGGIRLVQFMGIERNSIQSPRGRVEYCCTSVIEIKGMFVGEMDFNIATTIFHRYNDTILLTLPEIFS